MTAWLADYSPWTEIIGVAASVFVAFLAWRQFRPQSGRGGDAYIEDGDGHALGGPGGHGPRGGDGGNAKIIRGSGKAVGGKGGDS